MYTLISIGLVIAIIVGLILSVYIVPCLVGSVYSKIMVTDYSLHTFCKGNMAIGWIILIILGLIILVIADLYNYFYPIVVDKVLGL